ncbi:MAG: hypothetical protein ABSD97_00540 [Acidimicrobiales bacterium]
MNSAVATAVCIESVPRRVFASALDWPGWCRSGRTEDEALEILAAYAKRYAVVAAVSGTVFSPDAGERLEVVERLEGNSTTEFGVPAIPADYERQPVNKTEAKRLAALVLACWQVFDDVVAVAPAELRKGPRGGGRDRDQIERHVSDAEISYARKLGVRLGNDLPAIRAALIGLLGSPCDDAPVVEKGWPPRYGARRIAWHVMDHAWEIEDKS